MQSLENIFKRDGSIAERLAQSIMGTILDEVVGPDVIGVLGAEANTRPVRAFIYLT